MRALVNVYTALHNLEPRPSLEKSVAIIVNLFSTKKSSHDVLYRELLLPLMKAVSVLQYTTAHTNCKSTLYRIFQLGQQWATSSISCIRKDAYQSLKKWVFYVQEKRNRDNICLQLYKEVKDIEGVQLSPAVRKIASMVTRYLCTDLWSIS